MSEAWSHRAAVLFQDTAKGHLCFFAAGTHRNVPLLDGLCTVLHDYKSLLTVLGQRLVPRTSAVLVLNVTGCTAYE